MQRLRAARRLALVAVALGVVIAAAMTPPAARAQDVGVVQSEVLVLDPERLFRNTEYGQSISADIQAERERIIEDNRKLEAELEAEEKALTEKRPEMSPEAFRDAADAFDKKVRRIRKENERAVRDLERRRERAPVTFMKRVEPILARVMREAGGVVVLDKRSTLLSADVIDITDLAIERVNRAVGDGREDGQQGD
ncbi:OmpH family outer membrane protein [Roseovarius salinarum]|uniref:OmpH family outer membrane protein n=1 Tax=Roseovarius salinarum TaxID=1981892 RepID=UPI000C335ABE|nr:OmpH family outer membrane protein [Roseovarius salinarum]